jgi:outer membrane protein assembly factor BamB
MKNIFFLIFLLTLISCKKNNQNLVDLDYFVNQGEKITLDVDQNFNSKEISFIKKLQEQEYFAYKTWNQKNQNSNNFIQAISFKLNKRKDRVTKNLQEFIFYNNRIITIDEKSEVAIYDLNFKKIKSKKIYKRKIYKNYKLKHSIFAHNNKLYVSNNLGSVLCIDIKTLQILWEKKFGVPFKSQIKIYKENLYLINSNSKIFSINVKNGNLNWSFETSSKYLKDDKSYQLAVFNNKLFFTNDNSEIYCIDLNSQRIIWSLSFGNKNFSNAPLIFKASPITIDNNGELFVSTNNGFTYNLSLDTGQIKWATPIYSLNRFSLTKKYLINTNQDKIFVINKKNGNILLNKKINNKKKFFFKDLVIARKNIYLFDANGYLISISKKNLNNISIQKNFNKYSDLIFYKNSLYINTSYSIEKF